MRCFLDKILLPTFGLQSKIQLVTQRLFLVILGVIDSHIKIFKLYVLLLTVFKGKLYES